MLDLPAEAFAIKAVLTMLADDRAVQSVILDGDVLRAAIKHCVHVMMATISPAIVETLQQAHRRAGIAYVSAAVFGVPAIAAKGELNIMVAGTNRPLQKRRRCSTRWVRRPGLSVKIQSTRTSPRSPAIS